MSTHNEPTAEDVEVARAAYHAVLPGGNKAGREGMRAALLADRARRPSTPAVAFDEVGIEALAERFRAAIGSGPLSDIRTGTRALAPLIAEAAFAAVEQAAVTRWVVSECVAEARRSLRIPTPVEAPKVTLSTGIPSTSLRTNDGKALACCPLCESGTELPHTIRDCFASMRELGQAEAHPRVVRAAIEADRAAVRAALDGSSADVRGTFDHACHVVDAKSPGRSMWFTPAATPPVALAPSVVEEVARAITDAAITGSKAEQIDPGMFWSQCSEASRESWRRCALAAIAVMARWMGSAEAVEAFAEAIRGCDRPTNRHNIARGLAAVSCVVFGEAEPAQSCKEQLDTSQHHLAIVARIAGGERMAIGWLREQLGTNGLATLDAAKSALASPAAAPAAFRAMADAAGPVPMPMMAKAEAPTAATRVDVPCPVKPAWVEGWAKGEIETTPVVDDVHCVVNVATDSEIEAHAITLAWLVREVAAMREGGR